MEISYPLPDVAICLRDKISIVANPVFTGENWQSSQDEFSMQVEGVGSFYSKDGNHVEYSQVPGADPEWVKLYLTNQVLVSLLHQRKLINFHASTFIYNNKGIMILGETGSGKSSLTVSFALNGAGFMTDDLTPVIFREGIACIMPLYKDVKLRPDTAERLDIDTARLRDAEAGTGKHYFEIRPVRTEYHMLDVIMKITVGDCLQPIFSEPSAAEKFSILRSEICSWEILGGMPETEADYMHQLLEIVRHVRFVKVVRPAEIEIGDFYLAVRDYLDKLK